MCRVPGPSFLCQCPRSWRLGRLQTSWGTPSPAPSPRPYLLLQTQDDTATLTTSTNGTVRSIRSTHQDYLLFSKQQKVAFNHNYTNSIRIICTQSASCSLNLMFFLISFKKGPLQTPINTAAKHTEHVLIPVIHSPRNLSEVSGGSRWHMYQVKWKISAAGSCTSASLINTTERNNQRMSKNPAVCRV